MDIIPVTFLISTYYTSAYRYYTNIFFSVIQQPSTPPFCPRFPSWEKSCRDFLGRKGEEFQVTIPGSWTQPKIPQVLWRVGLSWHPYQTSFCVYFTVFFTVKTFLNPSINRWLGWNWIIIVLINLHHQPPLIMGSPFSLSPAEPHRAAPQEARLRRSRARPRSFSWKIWRNSLHWSEPIDMSQNCF